MEAGAIFCVRSPKSCYAPPWFANHRPGYYASRKSHLSVLERAYVEQLDEVLVLEDDIDPCPHLTEWFDHTYSILPEGWMGVQFGGRHDSPPTPIQPGLVRLWRFLECPFALYSRRGIERILEHCAYWAHEIFDQALMKLYHDEPHFYAPDLLPVGQTLSPSENDPWMGQQRLSPHWPLRVAPPPACPVSLRPAYFIDGNMEDEELRWIYDMAKGKKVVEIGSLKGRSAFAWLAGGAEKLVSVDPGTELWGPDVMRLWLRTNLKSYGERFALVQRRSDDPAVPHEVESLLGTADLVFIDGDHSELGVKSDLALARRLLRREGGIVCGHDYGKNKVGDECVGVQKAVDVIFPEVNRPAGTLWAHFYP